MERTVRRKKGTQLGMLGAVVSGALDTAAPAGRWEVIGDPGTGPSPALGLRD